jgi:hypothetical protein
VPVQTHRSTLRSHYLFDGQYQKAYLEFFGFPYKVVGVKHDSNGFYFSDEPDEPPPLDYTKLINIVDDQKMNAVGNGAYALSKSWYEKRGYGSKDIQASLIGETPSTAPAIQL